MRRADVAGLRLPLAVAVIAGLLAVWLVRSEIDRASMQGGEPVTVLVANQRLDAGVAIDDGATATQLSERMIPAEYAPVDAIGSRDELIGATLVSGVEAGAIITRPLLAQRADATDHKLRKRERAVSVGVRAAPDGAVIVAGDRVDLIASGFDGAPSSELLLSGAQVLAANESDEKPGVQRLTLRVAAEQSAGLVRADVFARELRAIKLEARSRRNG